MKRLDTPIEVIHRFELDGKRYAVDVDTCFCFECDAISWDVLEYYPHTTPNRIIHLLRERHDPVEVGEVISELEWLRATKSIIPITKIQDVPGLFTVEPGLKSVTVVLPSEEGPAQRAERRWFSRHGAQENGADAAKAMEIGRGALALLFGRAGEQKELQFEMVIGAPADPIPIVESLGAEAFRQARLAGKKITVAVLVPDPAVDSIPASLEHQLSVRLEFTRPEALTEQMRPVLKARATLSRLLKAAAPDDASLRACVVLCPGSARFVDAVKALHQAGVQDIDLDLESSYSRQCTLDASAVQHELAATAAYYAERLLKNDYFRLEPIATLFAHIYHGIPRRRTDPAGVHALGVDAEGGIWPTLRLCGHEAYRIGNVLMGEFDEARNAPFVDVGVMTSPECMRCWARHLCGGGSAAIHHALTGSVRTPHQPWCDAQRAWMMAAVSAFNTLSSQGVHFTRIYQSLSRKGRPSIFQLARTSLKMSVIMRPLAEADAPMLRDWQNWSTASYFLLDPAGTLLTTHYDREMDALYPLGASQEMILTTRRGDPLGLVKMKPDRWPGVQRAWVYLHRPSDYAAASVSSGFRELVKQLAQAQDVRRLVFQAADYEPALRKFLAGCGFTHEGTLREAVYTHAGYHDVHVYGAAVTQL